MRIKARLFTLLLLIAPASWALNPAQLVKDARSQIGKTLYYDPAYSALRYPMGDVPLLKGVCTDVVIRALRHQGMDLQQGIHEDMRASFKRYPQKWGLKGPDRKRYAPGDIVTWDLGRGLAHIGIVSDRKSFNQTPLIIHNIGQGAREENILHQYAITGHYRLKR